MQKQINILRTSLIIINIIGFFVAGVLFLFNIGLTPVDENSTIDIPFVITQTDSLKDISKNLKDKGIIRSEFVFYAKSYVVGNYYHYIPDEYCLSKSMSVDDLIRLFSAN